LVDPPNLGPGAGDAADFPSAEHTQEGKFDPDGWDAAVASWLRTGPPSSVAL
jgi:hypothetical protein